MRKIALMLFLAVLLPSLALAWLAGRSLRDQQLVLERQQSLLYQGVADRVASDIVAQVTEQQRSFKDAVSALVEKQTSGAPFVSFDEMIRRVYPLARVGFVVTLDGQLIAPSLLGSPEARRFRVENEKFLTNRESVDVYWNGPKGAINLTKLDDGPPPPQIALQNAGIQSDQSYAGKKALRNVMPQQYQQQAIPVQREETQVYSKSTAAEAKFRQLVGDSQEGGLARFLQDELNLMFWCRLPGDPQTIYGALVDVPKLADSVRKSVRVDDPLASEIGMALIDDAGRRIATAPQHLEADWRRPFVASELGDVLPHWEVAVYQLDPARLEHAATTLRRTFGVLIAFLVIAIALGSVLIALDLRRHMVIARQKTDFVSNVSHELKTPLTSIRMFSELLAEGRVKDEQKRQTYLEIISAEAARLTRLINNVLSFARLERGEQRFEKCRFDLSESVTEIVSSYRPQLDALGFRLECSIPAEPILVEGDRDAIAQVIVNLLSNAEKYSGPAREMLVQLDRDESSVHVRVKDSGPGVPVGLEEKIFEQFFRADESLASGIQGSGLGLTLARQIARAHGGDVTYQPRRAGGSCFTLTLPVPKVI